MIHDKNALVIADNGTDIFTNDFMEDVLGRKFDRFIEDGIRMDRYEEWEILEEFEITANEFKIIGYLLSYDFNHNVEDLGEYGRSYMLQITHLSN
jgi:hypothetical protein